MLSMAPTTGSRTTMAAGERGYVRRKLGSTMSPSWDGMTTRCQGPPA